MNARQTDVEGADCRAHKRWLPLHSATCWDHLTFALLTNYVLALTVCFSDCSRRQQFETVNTSLMLADNIADAAVTLDSFIRGPSSPLR